MVGRVRRRMDRCDALQQLTRLVEAGQRSRVVEAGVVQGDRGLAGAGFVLESVQCEDCLFGVLVHLDRVRRDCSAGRGEGAEEGLGRLPPVHGQSGALSSGELHAAGPGLMLQADLEGYSELTRCQGKTLVRRGSDKGFE